MMTTDRRAAGGAQRLGGWAKRTLQGAALMAVAVSVPAAWGGGNNLQVTSVAAGAAAVSRAGSVTTVRTGSDRTIINYSRLSVPRGETLQFVQPSARSRVLNRIQGTEPTRIDGTLQSNGRVYLVNPAGVMFGQGSVVNVGGLFAAAGHMSNEDFLAGNNLFTGNTGTVRNDGMIRAGHGGVHLAGQQVANFGSIVTGDAGIVTLTAGKDVFIGEATSPTGNASVLVKVSGDRSAVKPGTGVTNSGSIDAGKGQLHMGAGDVYAAGIFNDGSLKGRAITLNANASTTVNKGRIDATSDQGKGGSITLIGKQVGLFAGTVDASGAAGGGMVRVGGDLQGAGDLPVSEKVIVADGAAVRADALASGDGGTIIVYASGAALVGGELSVLNAPGGVGGFIETSGIEGLRVVQTPLIGEGGTWLIDPRNITISAGPQAGVDGTFTATADDAVIDVTTLENALDSGNVTVFTGATGTQAGSITLAADLNYNFPGNVSRVLTLQAASTISITANITQAGNDDLSVVLATPGDVLISGTIGTAGGSFTSGGAAFTLTGSIATGNGLVNLNHTGAVAINGALNAGTGAIAITAPTVSQTTGMSASTLTVAAAGTVNLPIANNVETFLVTNSLAGAAVTFVGGGNLAVGRIDAVLPSTTGGALVLQSGGVLTVSGGATGNLVTGTGNIRLISDDITLTGNILSTGNVQVEPLNNAQEIYIGSNDPGGVLSLSAAELGRINSGATLLVGSNTQTGDITVEEVSLVTAGPASINIDANAGNVILDDNGNGPALAVSGNIFINAAAITASNAANNHAELAVGSDASFITMTGTGVGTVTNPIEIGKFDGAVESGYDGTIVGSFGGGVFLKGIGNLVVGTVSSGGALDLRANGSIGGGGDISGTTVNLLAAGGGVGTSATPLGIGAAAGPLTISTGGAGTLGDIHLTAGGNVPALTVTTDAGTPQTTTVNGITTLVVNQDVTLPAGDTLVLRAPTGNLSFSAGRTLATDNLVLWAGNGLGTAAVDFTNAPTIHNNDNTAAPASVTLRQDAAIADAVLTGTQFDRGLPTTYTLRSETGTVAVVTTANITGTNLVLTSAGGVTLTGPVSLLSLTTTGATVITGNVTTTGTDVIIGGNLTLTGNITSARDVAINGTLEFRQNTTLTGRDLAITGDVSSEAGQFWTLASSFTRQSIFGGNIGAAANGEPGSLDLGAGTVTLGSGATVAVRTRENGGADGHITFGGAVVLNGNATLDASNSVGAGVTFGGAVDSAVGNTFTLVVNAPGITLFGGNVGGTTALGGVTTDPPGITQLGGSGAFAMTVASPITFNDDVVLIQNTTLTASGPGSDVTFNGTVLSQALQARTLTVNADGVTAFRGNVGDAIGGALGALTTDAAGTLVLGNGPAFGIIVQDGISLGENAELRANTTLQSNNAQGITMGGDVSSGAGGPFGITVNTGGTTWFRGGASAVNQLSTITTDAGGITQFGQGGTPITVETLGAQTYNDAVTLTGDATFRAPAMVFAGAAPAIEAGGNTLRLVSNNMTFSGPVQGAGGNLVLEPFQPSDAIVIGSTGVAPNTLYLTRAGLLTFVDGFASITIGNAAGAHAITVFSDAPVAPFDPVVFTDPVTIRTPGGTILLGSPNSNVTPAIYGSGNASIALVAGTIQMNASLLTNGNAISFTGNTTLGAAAIVRIKSHGTDGTNISVNGPAGGPISVGGAVNDDGTATILVIDAGFGGVPADVDMAASIGGLVPINGFGVAADEFRLRGDIRTTGNLGVAGVNTGLGIVEIIANTFVLVGDANPVIPTTVTIDTDSSGGLKNGGSFIAGGVVINALAGTGPVSLVIDTSAGGGLAGGALTLGDAGTSVALGGLVLNAGTADVSVGSVALTGAFTSGGGDFVSNGPIAAQETTLNHTGNVSINDDLNAAGFPVTITGLFIDLAPGAPLTGTAVSITDAAGIIVGDDVIATSGFTSIGTGASTFTLSATGSISTTNSPITIAHPGGLVLIDGPIAGGTGTVSVTGLGITTNGPGGSITGGTMMLNGGAGAVTLGGDVTASGPLTILGASFSNTGSIASQGITIDLTGPLVISSPINSAGFPVVLGGSTITVANGAIITGLTVSLTDTLGITIHAAITGTNGITGLGGSFLLSASGALATTDSAISLTYPSGLASLAGPVTAGQGAISITSAGVVQTAGGISAAALVLQGPGTFTVNQNNTVATLAAAVAGPLNFRNTSALAAGTVGAVAGINTGGGALALAVAGAGLTLNAPIVAGTVSASAAGITSTAGGTINGTAITLAGGAVTLNAAVAGTGPVAISGADFTSRAPLSAASLVVNHTGQVTIEASVSASAGINITGNGIMTFVPAALSGTSIFLNSGSSVNSISGPVNATGAFVASGASFANARPISAASISISHAAQVFIGDTLSSTGFVTLGGGAIITAAPVAGANISFTSGDTTTIGAQVSAAGEFTSTGVTFNLTGGGIAAAGSPITINHTGAVTLGSPVNAGGALAVNGSGITLNSQATGATAALSGNVITLNSALTGSGGVTITGSTLLVQFGGSLISTNGPIVATLSDAINLLGGTGAGTGPVTFTAPGISSDLAGTIAGGDVSITAAGGLSLAAAVNGNVAVALNGGSVLSTGGLIGPTVTVTATSSLTVAGTVISNAGGISLAAPGAARLSGGFNSATVFTAGDVQLAGNTSIQAAGAGGITLGDITTSGGAHNLVLQASLAAPSPAGGTISVGAIGGDGVPLGDVEFRTNGTVRLERILYARSATFGSALGTDLANVADRATIFSEGNLVAQVRDGFTMKQGQKLTVYDRNALAGDTQTDGTLAIWSEAEGSLIQLGDVSVTGRLFVQAGTLQDPGRILLMNRPAGRTLAPDGAAQGPQDNGADIFALGLAPRTPGQLTFFGAATGVNADLGALLTPMLFTGTLEIDNAALGPPGPATRFRIGALNTEGADTFWFRGIRLTINQDVLFTNQSSSAAPDGIPTPFTFGPVNGAVSPLLVRDIAVDGVTRVPQAASGSIIPRDVQTLQPERGQAITGALRDALRELGIYARDLRNEEIIEYLIGRALYDDVPYKLKVELSDNQVAANRLPFSPVLPTVDAYRRLFFKVAVDAQGKPILEDGKEKLEPQDEAIKTSFGRSWQKYRSTEEEDAATPAKYRAYLEANAATDPAAAEALANLNALRDLLAQIRSLGLTANEFDVSRKVLLAKVRPLNMSLEDLSEAVGGAAVAVANAAALK